MSEYSDILAALDASAKTALNEKATFTTTVFDEKGTKSFQIVMKFSHTTVEFNYSQGVGEDELAAAKALRDNFTGLLEHRKTKSTQTRQAIIEADDGLQTTYDAVITRLRGVP